MTPQEIKNRLGEKTLTRNEWLSLAMNYTSGRSIVAMCNGYSANEVIAFSDMIRYIRGHEMILAINLVRRVVPSLSIGNAMLIAKNI